MSRIEGSSQLRSIEDSESRQVARGDILPEKEIQPSETQTFNAEQTEVIKERTQELINEIVNTDAKLVIFLDRSARPLSWMMQSSWEKYSGGREIPKIKFVNIGREKLDNVAQSPSEPAKGNYDSEEGAKKAVKDFWSKFDSEEYVTKVRRDIRPLIKKDWSNPYNVGILLVDDYAVSGYSKLLAENFFKHNIPEVPVSSYVFFKREDEHVFGKENWQGTYLPWNTDKAYTLLSEDEYPERVTATPEHDSEKRKKGLALKQEIRRMFEE